MTADIVAAFVGRARIEANELPEVVRLVRDALAALANPAAAPPAAPAPVKLATAALVRKSVTHDHLTCLEDGLKLRSLKQHLRVKHGLTPAQYRAKWGLPDSYPMAAPDYARARSEFAKSMGLSNYRKAGGKA
jgi:predicted transcriptional regulator